LHTPGPPPSPVVASVAADVVGSLVCPVADVVPAVVDIVVVPCVVVAEPPPVSPPLSPQASAPAKKMLAKEEVLRIAVKCPEPAPPASGFFRPPPDIADMSLRPVCAEHMSLRPCLNRHPRERPRAPRAPDPSDTSLAARPDPAHAPGVPDDLAPRDRVPADLRRLVRLLDSAVRIPGTRIRVGLDPLLGLLPGLGDSLSTLLSGWVVVRAAGLGASPATLARMLGNLLVDSVLGTLPVLGDLFDVGWRANQRNLALLEGQLADPARRRRRDRAVVVAVVAVALALPLALAALFAWLVHAALTR
jgi:hypothetical protein